MNQSNRAKPLRSLAELKAASDAARAKVGEAAWEAHRLAEAHKSRKYMRDSLERLRRFSDSPEGRARDAFLVRLEALREDSDIKQSATCLEVLEAFISCVTYRWGAADAAGMIDLLAPHFSAQAAALGANTKNAQYQAPREFVKSEWAVHRDSYEGNKSAFARDYAARVKREHGVSVTEKTIRESWIK